MGYVEDKAMQGQGLVGKRVEIPMHYDAWMQGARYGRVMSVGKDHIRVLLDKRPRVLKVWQMDYDYIRVL